MLSLGSALSLSCSAFLIASFVTSGWEIAGGQKWSSYRQNGHHIVKMVVLFSGVLLTLAPNESFSLCLHVSV